MVTFVPLFLLKCMHLKVAGYAYLHTLAAPLSECRYAMPNRQADLQQGGTPNTPIPTQIKKKQGRLYSATFPKVPI